MRDASGNVMSQATVTWSSQGPAIATVTSAGTVTGVSAGTTSVIATSGSATGGAVVTVRQAPAALTLTVTPGAASTSVGGTAAFTVVARDANGVVQPTPTITAWTTGNPSVASVSSGGVATGLAAGTTIIGATAGTIVATPASLTVTPLTLTVIPGTQVTGVGGTVPFTVEARDATGTIRPTPTITAWTTSAATVATVSSGGVATGVAAGTAMIGAMAGTVAATPAALTVTAPASCAAIRTKASWDVIVDVTWAQTSVNSSNHQIKTDHGIQLVSTLSNPLDDGTEVHWEGPISGTARVNDEDVALGSSPQTKEKLTGQGSILKVASGNPLPGMSLWVDPVTCRYRMQVTPWILMTLTRSSGPPEQAVLPVGTLVFAWRPVYDSAGKIAAGYVDDDFPSHSGFWLAFNPNADAYIPDGFGILAFDALAVGELPRGYAVVTLAIR